MSTLYCDTGVYRHDRRGSTTSIGSHVFHRKSMRSVALVVLLAFGASSCAAMQQTYQENPKAVLGGALGAGAGAGIAAIAGASPGWIVASALIGGLVGGVAGKKLDDRDKRMAAEAATQAFEQNRTGQASAWQNPDSGNSGTITPTKTYQLANGQYCREYNQTITVGGEKHQAYGTACRQPDGTWKIQS
jgi:surface antigen